jgi:hypothetical protein
MKRIAGRALAALVAACVVASCSGPVANEGHRVSIGGPGRNQRELDEIRRADPSKVIAAELAFARLAQEKGQWTAFAETSTDEAVMFVPQPVNAHEWLRGRANPAQAVRWQPHQVWSSCDGTLAVTKGAWQRADGTVGYFTTVWERQRDGEYKWVMDQGDGLEQALAAPEFVGAVAADCATRPVAEAIAAVGSAELRQGQSKDGTLRWAVVTSSDGSRRVSARYWDGAAWQDAIREEVAAGG